MNFSRPRPVPFGLLEVVAWVAGVLGRLPLLDAVVFVGITVRRSSLDGFNVLGRTMTRYRAAYAVVKGTARQVQGTVPTDLMMAKLCPDEFQMPKGFRNVGPKRWRTLLADRATILDALDRVGQGMRAEEMVAAIGISETRIRAALKLCQGLYELTDLGDKGWFTSTGLEEERQAAQAFYWRQRLRAKNGQMARAA